MKNQTHTLPQFIAGTAAAACILALAGCGPSESPSPSTAPGGGTPSKPASAAQKQTLQVQGSDTMVNLAQAWAEAYGKVNADLSIEVGGGGSGVGIAALINGTIDIANSSREMKADEKTKAKTNSGKEPKEITVGYDALAIFVHKDNPLNEITVDQLASIFGESGTIAKWSGLGVKVPGCQSDEIIRVSRQSNSGTYEFFREHVLNKKDFRLGSRDMNGSKEVVDLISHTPCAIGYSGMGYATPAVKMVKVAPKAGAPAIPPSVETALNKTYPIARPLYLITLGEPAGGTKTYIDWVLSPPGQVIVEQSGYVPLKATGSAAK